MWLTLPLLMLKNPKGHLFRGKYRLVKRVSRNAMETLKIKWQLEEQNMLLLRHPYLNAEETKCLRAVEEKPVYMDIHHGRRNAKYERRRLLADELNHLNNTQGWEFKGGYQ
ncbi:Hypothetical protein NTJ_05970 [Nesidiocoris tenuis]|uniref:Ribosomal protein 63, mitochondrial n=1 Tax=Nesidiocoris tenuis TaxID=355587 RepID=A0ABN7ALP1_9HEMI|nr:Hypothetical protein NTJ_05970 [Nesidiocoris tenuis]